MFSETKTTTDSTSAAEFATGTSDVISTIVTELKTETDSVIAEKIKELAAEIATTQSIWVKIRNTGEIGILSLALAKAVNKLEDIKD